MSGIVFIWIAILLSLLGVLSASVVGTFRRWAIRHLLDVPNERSSHSTLTPKGGGIGIAAVSLLLVATLLIHHFDRGLLVYLLVAGGIAVLGFVDDRHELSARIRLLIQAVIAVILVTIIGAFKGVTLPLLGTIPVPIMLGIPLTMIWIVAVTNIYNFMDGIDGLAGIQAVVAGIAWAVLFWRAGQADLALLAGGIAATSIGFLYWNWPPARIFMGDVGSTFLGFTFATLPLLGYARLADSRLLIVGALFIGPFLFDGSFTIIRRAIAGENVLKAHRSHLYQQLAKAGYSHFVINMIYVPLMILSAGVGFALAEVAQIPQF